MKYVIGFGAICVISGLVATFWLWWYAERSISLRASSVGIPHADDNSNSIVQPLLAEEHGSSSASKPQRDRHPAEAIEAQEQQDEATPSVGDAGGGAVAAPSVDVQQDGQRNDSNSSGSGSSSSNIKSSPPKAVETFVGDTTPEESRASAVAAQEEQKQQENNSSNSKISSSKISSSPVARVGGNGDSQDPPAGEEGNGAGARTEGLGELREVPSSGGEGEPATAR